MSEVRIPNPFRRIVKVVLAVVLVAVATTAGIVGWDHLQRCDDEDSVRSVGGECVGVTAGGSDFDQPALGEIIGKIRQANEKAQQATKYVSVAVFLPMTPQRNSLAPLSWVIHQLQGAYLAQAAFNDRSALPKVRLLLANPGDRMDAWERVTDELADRRAEPDNLVAVTGIGLSLGYADNAMRKLSGLGIPMVGSTISADDLDSIPGLLRPAPTNVRQAQAAATYAKDELRATTAMLVVDTNKNDAYSRTLAAAFRARFTDATHRVLEVEQQYDSSLEGVDNTFALMQPNLCAAKAEFVYFAGRGRDLLQLINRLAGRLCQERTITVLAGDDLASGSVTPNSVRAGLDANVRVIYTELAHPGAWAVDRERPAAQRQFSDTTINRFLKQAPDSQGCFQCLFGSESLEDGAAIMSHDAVLTATTAIQLTASQDGDHVTTQRLLQTFKVLNGETAVAGSSGKLSYDNKGTVQGKVVPLLRLNADGSSTFLHLETG
ncbi:hypothetical protein ACFWY9_21975 [Amycolatopsis sp. NPDC059027]|uniref:hypothetical protein n=1 Tax=unclassified Amycolatopsis TaxID=2618356 RepID=UPI00366F500D